MKRIAAILLIVWAALNFIGTLMPLPDELQLFSKSPNSVRWGALCIALIGLAVLKYPRYCSWNGVKNLLHLGISWEQGEWYFLGMTGSSNPSDTRITGFQLRGFNNARQPLRNARAYLVLPQGEEMPLRITTSDGRMDSAPCVDIGPRTTLHINGQFGSLTPADFVARQTPIRFVLEWTGGNLTHGFSRRQIERLIRRFEHDSSPKPDSF